MTLKADAESMDAELRGILVEHELGYGAWRLERVGILTKGGLQRLWGEGDDLFGTEGYSRSTLEVFRRVLRQYGCCEK